MTAHGQSKASRRQPGVTVIVTNHNYARFLPEAISSVLAQSYRNFELVVVDDGSTDNSRSLLEHLSRNDDRIRLHFQPNAGQAEAFNSGFLHANAPIVCFLDADDRWTPDKLATVVSSFQARPDSTALIQHNLRLVNGSEATEDLYRPYLVTGNVIDDLVTGNRIDFFVPTSGLSFRRSTLGRILPMPSALRICADAYLTRAAMAHGSLFSLQEPLGHYRIHDTNNWTGNPGRVDPDMVQNKVMPLVENHYRNSGLAVPERRNYCALHREAGIIAKWVVLKLQRSLDRYGRAVLYGAGAHSRWLLGLLSAEGRNSARELGIVAILDDQADRCSPIHGLPVLFPADPITEGVDAVVMSTDCHQAEIRSAVRHSMGDDMPVIDLYEGLPPGPFSKLHLWSKSDRAPGFEKPDPVAGRLNEEELKYAC